MTPQERQMIDDLFDRLARLESAPRDSEAARAIAEGSARAPNALYALVQTTLLQDEALRRANERIEALEAGQNEKSGSFLDSMRDTLFGGQPARGSVPSVRPPDTGRPVWNSGGTGYAPAGAPQPGYAPQGYPQQGFPQQQAGGGSSFLGTAAAAAAGMVGGSLLLGSIRNMMGGSHQSFGDGGGLAGSLGGDRKPWGGDQSGSDLARDAGINDIGSSGNRADADSSRAGFFDQASNDGPPDHDDMDLDSDNFGGDGDSDYA